MGIAILPLTLYGIHLAVSGDFLLLILIFLSAAVWALPKLLSEQNPRLQEVEETSGTGILDAGKHVFALPPKQITGDITLGGPTEACTSFVSKLFHDAVEEIWCLADLGLNCYKIIAWDSSSDIRDLLDRSKISLPFTVIADEESWQRLMVSPWPQDRSFRLILLSAKALSTQSNLFVSITREGIRAQGNLGDQNVELILRDELLASEPADNLRQERASASGSFQLVGQASGKHRSSSSNESKWFNFPAWRVVIDKTKLRFRALSSKNQVRQSLASEVRGADAVSDVSARLRNLGHGV